jgi:hypothetical protein
MNKATRSAGLGVAFCAVVWLCTGMWQFMALATIGMAFTWALTPQPRVHAELFRACYDYGGCQWAGDGCKGKSSFSTWETHTSGCPHSR